jgi:N-acyl-D-aspartate/D-glutamate deacylase
MKDAIRLLEDAREQGVKVTADLYIYPECVTSPLALVFNIPNDLYHLDEFLPLLDYFYIFKRLEDPLGINRWRDSLPPDRGRWFESYTTGLAAALSDPEDKERIKDLTLRGAPDKLNWVTMFGWDSFKIIKAPRNKSLIGRTLSEVSRDKNREPFDVAVELLLQEKNDLVISVFTMSDPDIASALQKDWMMVGSDAGALTMKAGPDAHPGSFGTFPRIFRKFVREEGILTLEEAVRKLSFLPARFLGLDDRGSLVKGAKADLVVFDPKNIQEEEGGFDASHRRPGIDYVVINGRISLEKGAWNHSLNGRVLLHGRGLINADDYSKESP